MRSPLPRRWTLCSVAILIFAGAGSVRADAPAKRARLDGATRLAAARMLAPEALGGRAGRVPVSVRIDGGAAALTRLGLSARGAGPTTAYAELAPEEIARLAGTDGVQAIERTRKLFVTLDRSVAQTGAPAVRASLGLDGRGVLVGVVDTGVDFRHADLRDATGKTRIDALLDLATARGTEHPDLPDYAKGAVWLAADLDAQLAAEAGGMSPAVPVGERDDNGHGTHVAGIAASSGLATARGLPSGRYVGMAPGARLVVAKASRDGGDFGEEDVVTSLRFVLDRAAALGRPVVVNMSLGGEGGPHDGTANLERAISDLVPADKRGVALVVSAGNGGGRDHHAGGLELPSGSVELRLEIPSNAPRTQPLSVEIWTDGPPPPITLVDPLGGTHGPLLSGHKLDDGATDLTNLSGHVVIDAASQGADPVNHRYETAVYVVGIGTQPVGAGTWRLILDGSDGAGARTGRWDAFLTGVEPGQTRPRFLDYLDEDSRADYPAFARGAIVVGSVVSRSGWTTADGRTITRGTVVGRPSTFSGTGPTLDGRFLPDVVAPGDFILSALSVDAPASSPASVFYVAGDSGLLVGDDGLHGALRGTSQASPHVAGAIALLFQLDPTLTPARIRELLRTAAAVDANDPAYSTRTGFGRLDVARAVSLLRRDPAGTVDPVMSSLGASRDVLLPGEMRTTITVTPRDATAAPIGPGHAVDIDADAGRWDGPVTDMGEGRYERVLIADGARGTAATITARADGVPLAARPQIWFVRDRTEVGRPFVAVGGCALDRAPFASSSWRVALFGAALLALFGMRRRRARRN